MNKDINYYMNLNYKIEVFEDTVEGGFAIQCPELPGCVTSVDTLEKGYKMIQDAKYNWFASCLENNIPIPEPVGFSDLELAKVMRKLGYKGKSIEKVINNMEQIIDDVKNENREYNTETLQAFQEAEQIMNDYKNSTRKPKTYSSANEMFFAMDIEDKLEESLAIANDPSAKRYTHEEVFEPLREKYGYEP